jgi:diguanylate cyclase (GGDEF)-like protein
MSTQTMPDHDDHAGGLAAPMRDELRLVRFRLTLVIASTALMTFVVTGAVVAFIAGGPSGGFAAMIGSAPIPPIILLPLVVLASIALTVRLARLVVHPAEELDAARRRVGDLYASARTDALQDSLTGLGNHRAFQEEFDRQLDLVRRYGQTVCLLLIDLDDFKTVNDSAGHAAGDAVLVRMADVLRGGLRRSDRAFRIGGDEFAVLMPSTTADEATVVGRRILSSCLEPRRDAGFERGFSFSAGIAAAPDMGTTRADVHARADDALYACKRDGRTAVRVYQEDQDDRPLAGERLQRASDAIVRIVSSNAIEPRYQPIVDLQDGAVVGFEGLARPIAGSAFEDAGTLFATAEASGRTADLDWLCIRAILAGADALAPDQTLSLNLSPQTITAAEFHPKPLAALIARSGLTPDRIILELTERQGADDIELLRSKLGACQQAGFRIAIDDVGSGNAGLRLLSQIHFDIVKIDLSLVQAGAQRVTALDVVRSLTELARRWGAHVVAEGVETTSQLEMVRALGLAHGQGYLLGRPAARPTERIIDIDALLAEQGVPALLRALATA